MDTDFLALIDRYNVVVKKYGELSLEIANKLDQFSKYRTELQFIRSEFEKKGFINQDSEELLKKIQEELNKREVDNGTTTNQRQTDTES